MKKLLLIVSMACIALFSMAQVTPGNKKSKDGKRDEKRQRVNSMVKQEEEGVLAYSKQSAFGLELRTNGYGAFYEIGRMKSPRRTTMYSLEFSEIKHSKEVKSASGISFFGNPYIYGKLNNFYQLKLGLGQQYIFGQKGNKNGVAVTGIYQGGFSAGLLRPYYLQVQNSTGSAETIRYTKADSLTFSDPNSIIAGGGFGKGWSEIKFQPGAYAKIALRFDYGRFNEVVSALEIGLSVDAYAKKIPIMLYTDDKRFFFQGHIAILFGKRK